MLIVDNRRLFPLASHDHLYVIDAIGSSRKYESARENAQLKNIVDGYVEGSWHWTIGIDGKPMISCDHDQKLFVSISHSGSLLVLLISAMGDVGVDCEEIKPRAYASRIARRFFGASNLSLEEFYREWIAREAYVKALGGRLLQKLTHINFHAPTIGQSEQTHKIDFLTHENYLIAACRPRSSTRLLKSFVIKNQI